MTILIVGLGSMGKRRARLAAGLGHKIIGVDSAVSRQQEASALGITPYGSINAALQANTCDAAFVCTAPLSHSVLIDELLDNNLPVFTELNLVDDGYQQLMEKAEKKKLTLFLSNTMLYRSEIGFIREQLAAFTKPVNYVYHIGQYLPDWHPWENYKDFFVGDARSGGVREIFGIELPWLVTCFGAARPVCVQADNISALDLPYADSVFVTLRHENGAKGIIAVDVVSPKPVRNFEVFGEGLHLFWEGNPDSLYQYDLVSKQKKQVQVYQNYTHDTCYSDNVVENAYLEEILNFFQILEGKGTPHWDFARDQQVIALMDQIESTGKEATK